MKSRAAAMIMDANKFCEASSAAAQSCGRRSRPSRRRRKRDNVILHYCATVWIHCRRVVSLGLTFDIHWVDTNAWTSLPCRAGNHSPLVQSPSNYSQRKVKWDARCWRGDSGGPWVDNEMSPEAGSMWWEEIDSAHRGLPVAVDRCWRVLCVCVTSQRRWHARHVTRSPLCGRIQCRWHSVGIRQTGDTTKICLSIANFWLWKV